LLQNLSGRWLATIRRDTNHRTYLINIELENWFPGPEGVRSIFRPCASDVDIGFLQMIFLDDA
jgi:hypothetical protein